MAIRLPQGLPAADKLRNEGIAVVDDGSTVSRPCVRIAMVNLMPRKEATELAFARLLAQSGEDIELTLVVPATYRPRNVSTQHMERFYKRWPEIRNEVFDGLIVTGAPVETLSFEDVSYWNEMREIFGWAKANTGAALYICWAAQAALYALRGIQKHALADKAFGIFEQTVMAPSSTLMRGMGHAFPAPVSRHTAVSEQALAAAGLTPLARSAETGACIVEDDENRAVYIFDHLEYDDDTLDLEFERDLLAGKAIAPPFVSRPGWSWKPYAALFIRNWLDKAGVGQDKADPSLVWLFQDRMRQRQGSAELLLQAASQPHLLAEALAHLDRAGVGPRSARVWRRSDRMSLVAIQLDDLNVLSAEDAAGALLRIPGTRRVLYRGSDGSGGVLRPKPNGAPLTWAA